jgi:hypothetical protein
MRVVPPASRRTQLASFAVATALTLGSVAVVLGALRVRELPAWLRDVAPAPEQVTLTVAPSPTVTAPRELPRTSPSAVESPRLERATPVAPRGDALVTPAPPAAPRDTGGAARGVRPPTTPPPIPLRPAITPLPSTPLVPPAPAVGTGVGELGERTTGLARRPMPRDSAYGLWRRGIERATVGGAAPPIVPSDAERDARWREKSAASRNTTGPQPLQKAGVTVGVGLPGGGPSNAQRARDRATHAENLTVLARIRTQGDSIIAARRRADSLAAARRGDSLARPAPTRRDTGAP